ncbi:MAG: hypothetical protein LBK95_08230 [Bifidobacteriaceae bacterium]|jgi:hypothetical protein|nr:hypothetical protein [Bifidobacteriaceae bacterium]
MKKLRLLVAAVAGAVLFTALTAGGATQAKWSSEAFSSGTRVPSLKAVIKLSEINGQGAATVVDTVTAGDKTLTVPFGPDQAMEIRAAIESGDPEEPVFWAKPYQITGNTYGTMGFGYTGSVPDLSANRYGGELALFKVDDAASCTAATVKANWGNYPGQANGGVSQADELRAGSAISAKYGKAKTYSQTYCLATKFTPEEATNTATASGATSNGVKVTATDSWSAFVLPSTAGEPDVKFDFTMNFFGPE